MVKVEERRLFLKGLAATAAWAAFPFAQTSVFAQTEWKRPPIQKDLRAPVWTSASAVGSKITLQWNAVPNAGSYRIECQKGSGEWQTLKDGATSTSYSFAGTKGTTYAFRLYALPKSEPVWSEGLGYITWRRSSASLTKKVAVTAENLAAPTWKSAAVSGRKITLKWNAVPNAGSYTIQYKINSGAWATLKKGLKTTKYSFDGKTGAKYSFRLFANSNKSGYAKSDASATKTAKINGEKLATPTISVSTGTSKTAYVGWNCNGAPFTGVYQIQYRKKGATTWTSKYAECKTENWNGAGTYKITGLENDVKREFRVRALATEALQNAGFQNSEWSGVVAKKVARVKGATGSSVTCGDYNLSRNRRGVIC